MSAHARQSVTDVKRAGVPPARTRSARTRTAGPGWRPAGDHELPSATLRRRSVTGCGCGCGGTCGDAQIAAEPEAISVNPEELESEESQTADDAGVPKDAPTPAPAPPVTPPKPPAPAATPSCAIDTGPTYTPSGNIPVTTSGGRKKAKWKMAAKFKTDAAKSIAPRCCEVRQYVKWDKKFHDDAGGPPHSGFPSSSTYDTWYEDRNGADTLRYGHRSGTWGTPVSGCGNEYKTGATQDQANGDTYCGNDNPQTFKRG